MRCKYVQLVIVFTIFIAGCGPKLDQSPKCENGTNFKQDFKSDIALIVLEWNCKPYGYGSGFLIDKEKGAFYTNKHVSVMFDELGKGSHKIFFNGRVYNASIVRVHPLADAALVKITDKFDPSEFPEPAPIFQGELKVGEPLFVEGFHPHPRYIRQGDEEAGYRFPIIPIFGDYYGLDTKNLEKEREVVHERLDAKVVELNKKTNIANESARNIQGIKNKVNLYAEVKTEKDHKFSFGGLSGSAIRNKKGEIVGIVTLENTEEYQKVKEMDQFVLLKKVFQTLYVTPIELVETLRRYLK